jgi:hypothetical protein
MRVSRVAVHGAVRDLVPVCTGNGLVFARESVHLCALWVAGGEARLRSADEDVRALGYFRDASWWRMYPQKSGENASVFVYAISKYVVWW